MIRHLKTLLRTLDILLFGYPGWNLIHLTFPLQRADKEKAVAAVIVADLTDCPHSLLSPVSCGGGSRCSNTVEIAWWTSIRNHFKELQCISCDIAELGKLHNLDMQKCHFNIKVLIECPFWSSKNCHFWGTCHNN